MLYLKKKTKQDNIKNINDLKKKKKKANMKNQIFLKRKVHPPNRKTKRNYSKPPLSQGLYAQLNRFQFFFSFFIRLLGWQQKIASLLGPLFFLIKTKSFCHFLFFLGRNIQFFENFTFILEF